MDPFTQIIMLCNTIAQIILLEMQSETPEMRAENAKRRHEMIQTLFEWLQKLSPK